MVGKTLDVVWWKVHGRCKAPSYLWVGSDSCQALSWEAAGGCSLDRLELVMLKAGVQPLAAAALKLGSKEP